MRRPAIAALLALCLLPVPQASAQTSDPAWLDELREQLAAEKECEVVLFLRMQEGTLAGRATQEARAQCADGRYFDASRTEPEPSFVITACEVQVC